MLEATRRCGSRLEFSATTAKTTSPGLRNFCPCARLSNLQLGGKMEETRTRFCAAMPASRSASSNEVRRSLCLPTPLVKKRRVGTMFMPNLEDPPGVWRYWHLATYFFVREGRALSKLSQSCGQLVTT